ncbi:MAG TPA: hypothetical protein DEF51_43635 [Myxococcales bacterium]|nr:hypothetical protein [Myxococcales bacterium]
MDASKAVAHQPRAALVGQPSNAKVEVRVSLLELKARGLCERLDLGNRQPVRIEVDAELRVAVLALDVNAHDSFAAVQRGA